MSNLRHRSKAIDKWVWRGLSIAAVVSVAVAASYALSHEASLKAENGRSGASPNAEADTQTLAVVIVSSACRACQSKEFRTAERELVSALRRDGRALIHGVSLDADVNDGLKFLRKLGPFDEVSAGGGWQSVAAQQYVWGDLGGGTPMVPQILFISRIVRRLPGGVSIEEAKVDRRLIGVLEIQRFVNPNARLK